MNDTTKPDPSKIFPNGSYYWRNGVQIDPHSTEGQTIISIINQQHADRAKQTTTPRIDSPLTRAICTIFDIHTEKGDSKYGVIFSMSDFELLKRDTHIMAVINIHQVLASPNSTYAALKPWIIANSVTPVP